MDESGIALIYFFTAVPQVLCLFQSIEDRILRLKRRQLSQRSIISIFCAPVVAGLFLFGLIRLASHGMNKCVSPVQPLLIPVAVLLLYEVHMMKYT